MILFIIKPHLKGLLISKINFIGHFSSTDEYADAVVFKVGSEQNLMQIEEAPIEIADNLSWACSSPLKIEEADADILLYLYGILMSSYNANAKCFSSSDAKGQQFFSPDLNITLEVCMDLLEAGAIKLSAKSLAELLKDNNSTDIGVEDLKDCQFEVNSEAPLSIGRVCTQIKKEIIKRIKSENADLPQSFLNCWQLLNQAYCFNSINYRHASYGFEKGKRNLTTAEYMDLKDLANQLSIGWINTLVRRAFNWSAGKQKETQMSDARAADLAIGATIRQLTWATEETPIGEMFGRPKSLSAFGLERIFKDFLGITPEYLYERKPCIELINTALAKQF